MYLCVFCLCGPLLYLQRLVDVFQRWNSGSSYSWNCKSWSILKALQIIRFVFSPFLFPLSTITPSIFKWIISRYIYYLSNTRDIKVRILIVLQFRYIFFSISPFLVLQELEEYHMVSPKHIHEIVKIGIFLKISFHYSPRFSSYVRLS